jgi:hypothetical protein
LSVPRSVSDGEWLLYSGTIPNSERPNEQVPMQTESTSRDESDELRYEQGEDRYVFHYDDDDTATLTATIVHALASIADTDVSQGEFSLYDSIDPDALDRIFRPKADGTERTGGHIAFTALEHEVYVYANGDIVIYPPAESRRPGPRR